MLTREELHAALINYVNEIPKSQDILLTIIDNLTEYGMSYTAIFNALTGANHGSPPKR